MADNTQITNGAGDSIRDKDRAGVKTQVIGLDVGIGTGTEALMSTANPAPVNLVASTSNATQTSGSLTASVAQATGTTSNTGQVVADVSQMGNLTFHLVTSAFVGTLQFEATLDSAGTSTTWGPWLSVPEDGLTAGVTSLSINTASAFIKQYTTAIPGPKLFKVRCSSFTSGSLAVVIQPGPFLIESSPSLAPSNAIIGTINPTPSLTVGTATGNIFQARAAVTTATTAVLQAAPAAGLALYVTDISVSNSGAALSTVSLLPTAGISVIDIAAAPGGGGGSMSLQTPLRITTATGLSYTTSAASTTVYISATGYTAP
jgi:hypothetical protein